jgi:hypothetical protein
LSSWTAAPLYEPCGLHVRLPYCMAYVVAEGAISPLRSYFPMAALSAPLAAASRSISAPA